MILKALSSATLGIALLATTGSCPDGHRHAGTAAPEPAPSIERAPAGATSPPPTEPAPPAVRRAIEKAVPVLLDDGEAWMEGRAPFQDGDGCVSCHQVPYGVWALRAAAQGGIVADAEAQAGLARRAADFIDNRGTGRPMSWSPMMLGLRGAEDVDVSSYVEHLLRTQRPEGFWEAKGQFPAQRRELSETNAVATMFAMRALRLHGAEEPAIAESLGRAGRWVVDRGPGESTEWLVLRAMVGPIHPHDREDDGGVGHLHADHGESRRLRAQLWEQQNEDGGWSWKAGEASNAMSTGQVLWQARPEQEARPAERYERSRRGIEYLLATQGDDGWWRVPSRLISSGGEPSKDYVYDYWGTAWATIGLARWHQGALGAPPALD